MSARKQPGLLQRDLGSLFSRRTAEAEVEHPAFSPTLPQVDLLPQSIRDSVSIAHIRTNAIRIGLALVVVTAALWVWTGTLINQAAQELADVQAQGATLRASVQALTPIKSMVTQLEQQQELVNTALAAQPQADAVVEHLIAAGARTSGPAMAFDSIAVNYAPIPVPGGQLNPCPDPDPFGTEIAIGCLTFSATAGSRAQVAQLLDELEADSVFVGPYVSTSTIAATEGAGGKVAFSGSAGVAIEALRTPLSEEQVAAILTPPQPSGSPSPSPSPNAGG